MIFFCFFPVPFAAAFAAAVFPKGGSESLLSLSSDESSFFDFGFALDFALS